MEQQRPSSTVCLATLMGSMALMLWLDGMMMMMINGDSLVKRLQLQL
jgi:hypothetical protein